MKKIYAILITISVICTLSINALCNDQTFSWYCMHRSDGCQPECDGNMRFIEKYNGYYIDRSKKDSDDKVIYLTFDAGYENGNVEKILDVLKEEDVKGSFFILENLIKHDTALVCRMAEEGHAVCNHTAKHRDMTKMKDKASFEAELKSLEETYKEYTGHEMLKFYRPPEGKFNEQNLKWTDELGYKTVFWSFAYADWDNDRQPDQDRALAKIIGGTHNGEIILLHPTSSTNAAIMSSLIREWKKMGYRFATLEELGNNVTENN